MAIMYTLRRQSCKKSINAGALILSMNIKKISNIFVIIIAAIINLLFISNCLNAGIKINYPSQFYSTPDDELFAVVNKKQNFFIFSSNSEGFYNLYYSLEKDEEYLIKRITDTLFSDNLEPALSANAKTLVYQSYQNDAGGNIALIELSDISKISEISGVESIDYSPSIDKTGENIYFCQEKKGAKNTVITRYKKTTGIKNSIYIDSNIIDASVSPSNAYIALIANRNKKNYAVILELSDKPKKIFEAMLPAAESKSVIWSDDERLFFTMKPDKKYNFSLFEIQRFNSSDSLIIQITAEELNIVNPYISDNVLYYCSPKNSEKQKDFDIFKLEGIESYSSADLINAEPLEIKNIIYSFNVSDSDKKLCLANYLLLNKKKINNPSYRQLLLSAFDYFNFEKNFDALKNLSKFTEDKRAAELIDIISDFYLNLSDKSKTELKKANEHFVSVITKIANDPTIQTLIKLKAIEALGDYYSDSKITASIEYYNAIENDASADTETRLRISLKKARIYAKLEQKENYFTVIMNIVKNSGVNYFYLRKSLKEFITQIKFENSGKPAVDVIKNFEALAEKYKEVPQLCYAILDEAAAYAFESNERYYSKKILERIIEYFPKNKDYISEAYIKSGDIAYADEDFENSLKYYKRSIEYGVDIPEKKQRALNQYKLKYLAKGEFELKIKDYEKAYKTFFNLVEFDKSYIPAHRQYIKTGVMLGKLNELSAVYEEFKKIIISPHEKSAFNYASALLMTYQPNYKENLNTALRLVNAAIKIRREESCYYQLAGWINEQIELQLGKANRLERAVNLYKIGLGLINDNDLTQAAEFNLNIANAYYNMKNYEFAYKYYLESLTFENYFQNINKNILLVLYANLAHTGYYTNNFNIAEEYYKKAIFISSDTQQKQSFYERLSLMHYSAGNFTGAIDALKSSADLISGGYNPLKQYYINRAVLLYTLNRFKESAGLSMLEKLRAKKTLIGALTAVEDFYKKEYSEKTVQKNGFLDFKFNFSGSESDNSEGLDSITEQKFIYMLASDLYFSYYDNQNAIEIFRKRLNLIPDGVTPEKSPGLALEKSILLNNLSSLQIKAGDYSGAFLNLKNSIQLASDLNEEFGVYNNLFLMLEILNYYEEKDKKDFINTYLQFYKMYFKKIKIRVDSFDLVLSNAAAYYNEMLYKYEINELNNLFTDTISFYNRYISAYAKHIAAGRIIAEAIETIKLKRKAEPLLNALAVCAGVNYAAINDTLYNIKLIADSDLIQLSESVRWLNFQSAKNYDEMRKYEQNLLQYTLETAKFNGYNFLSKDILRQFYNRLFAVCKAEKDYISAAIYADHYLALLKYLTLNTKKNIFSLQFAGENDIAEIQSILNDSQSIGIFINLENDTLAFVINNSEILECTGTILSNNFLWLVNCSSPFIFQSKNSNSVFISSLTAFLKASSNRSIFFEKKAIINSSDAADISIDTDIDALFLKCGIELNNRDLYASKLKFAGGTISLDMLRDYNFRNVNYCEIDALLNKNIKSNDFNIFCSFFNDAGISSVRFKSVEALVSQNKNKDLITAGCAQYSYAEMTAIALEKSADLISAAADEYKKNNFNNALRNIQKLIELRVVLKFDKISLKKYYSFAVNSAYKFQDYSNCIKYQLEFISQLNAASIEYGRALYNLGIFYSLNEDFDSSAITLKKALQVYADDTQYVNKTIEELSKTAEFSGNYSSAADYIEGVIKQTENTDDLGRQYSRLGFLYYGRLNEYSTALEYFQKALRYFEKSKNKKNICRSLIDIGLVYMQIGDFIGAINNFDSALILAKKNSDTHIISEILLNTANIRWFEGDYKKAIEHIFEAVTFAETNKDEERKYLAYNTLGLIYWTLNNYDKAIFYLEKSLEISERLKKYCYYL